MSPVRFTTENGCGSHRLAPYHKRRRNTTNLEILNLSDWNKHHQEQEVIHQKEGDLKIYKLRDQNIKTGKQGCQRTVFYPELEESFDSRSADPYYITCKEFYQNVNKTGSNQVRGSRQQPRPQSRVWGGKTQAVEAGKGWRAWLGEGDSVVPREWEREYQHHRGGELLCGSPASRQEGEDDVVWSRSLHVSPTRCRSHVRPNSPALQSSSWKMSNLPPHRFWFKILIINYNS